jgi:steroid 5-alpha reductase family enzyme
VELLELYRTTDPLMSALAAAAIWSLWCWIASMLTGNYSQVDRLWSILPVLYVFHFAAHGTFTDLRLGLMTALVVLWGARLTYNYARKGGYQRGSEDYRWIVIQKRIGRTGFQLLNATFIAPFQNLLLLLIATPAYLASQVRGHPLGAIDLLAAGLFLAFLIGETVADQQQWKFHLDKERRRRDGERGGADFLTEGLFRYSRHPNFFCEQGMWWSFYLFAVSASDQWIAWPIAGAATLTLLFQGSTVLTEQITAGKYPSYREYQRRTSRLLPLPPKAARNPSS